MYQDEEVVVLNKPYGLPVHGEGRPSQRAERLLVPLVGNGTLGGGRKHPQTQRVPLLLCYRLLIPCMFPAQCGSSLWF